MKDIRRKFMKAAIRMGYRSLQGTGGPFGCVVVKDGKVIARSGNEVLKQQDPCAHAEILAIRKACKKLKSFQLTGCELYCTSEPCPMCLGAIYWARPSKVYYALSRKEAGASGFDDDLIYRELHREGNERRIPFEQFPARGAGELFRMWSGMPEKTIY